MLERHLAFRSLKVIVNEGNEGFAVYRSSLEQTVENLVKLKNLADGFSELFLRCSGILLFHCFSPIDVAKRWINERDVDVKGYRLALARSSSCPRNRTSTGGSLSQLLQPAPPILSKKSAPCSGARKPSRLLSVCIRKNGRPTTQSLPGVWSGGIPAYVMRYSAIWRNSGTAVDSA